MPFICLFSKPIANYIPRNTPFMKLRGPKLEIFIVARLVTGSNNVKPVMEFQGACAAQIRVVLWIHIFLSNEIRERNKVFQNIEGCMYIKTLFNDFWVKVRKI